MKYSDIKQYTSVGTYEINVWLGHFRKTIEEFQNEGLQLVPDFQRGNVWTEKQQIAYIEFLLKGGQTAKVIYLNYPGWMTDGKGEFTCVDGLQRTYALLMFLNDKLPVFDGNYLHEIEDRELMLRRVDIRINVNNLKTRKEVLQWYIDFNSGGTVHTEKEIQRVQRLLELEEE